MQIKRFAVLIPLVFVLLLSCVPLSSVFADEGNSYVDIETDYSDFDFSEYDLSDFYQYYNKDYLRDCLSSRNYDPFSYDYYIYSVGYTVGSDGRILVLPSIAYFNSSEYISSSTSHFSYLQFNLVWFSCCPFELYSDFSYYRRPSFSFYHQDYYYYFTSDYEDIFSGSFNIDNSIASYPYCENFFYFETNIPDFPYVDTISHPSSGLDVSVSFSPSLSGNVDRSVGSGSNISYLQNLSMTINNNSSFPCQYKFYIIKTNQSSHRPWSASGSDSSSVVAQHQTVYDDDPVFIYYSNEWVYSANLDNSSDWYNGHPQKQNKSTEWHYLSSNSSNVINFKFSQINLQEGESYTAIVEAVRNDYDCASRLWVSAATSEGVYPEYKQLSIDDKISVYSSSFTMLQYSDVKYDHNDNSNGINPYSNYSDLESYNWSYNAKEENGVTDYTNKNLYTDSNSWYRQSYNTSNISYPSSSSSFNSSTTYISSFLSFVSSVLGYFPSSIFNIYALGMTSLVVIVLIKVVFR